ncbi:MAG TPA: response regulator [Candidatus Acidoferrum sp.]|nr:response regulator [Candidatus Acidoferrum sp.]
MAPRLLLIEPSPELRRTFTDVLERRGLEVRAASSAELAIALCTTFSPDILIADHDLGDARAIGFLGELRRMYPGIVVLLTSDAFATEQKIGATTLLPKPSEPKALLGLLRRAVTADSLWHVRRGSAAG